MSRNHRRRRVRCKPSARRHAMLLWLLMMLAGGELRAQVEGSDPSPQPDTPPSPRLEIAWDSPEGCGSGSELEGELTLVLGAPPTTMMKKSLLARVRVRSKAPGELALELALEQGDEQHTRVLEAPTCPELVRAAAVVLAMAISAPEAQGSLGDTAPEHAAASREKPATPAPATRPVGPRAELVLLGARGAPERRGELRGLFGLAASGWIGVLPDPAVGGGIDVAVEYRHLHAEAGGVHAIASHELQGGRAGALLALDAAHLRGCWLAGATWVAGPCAGLLGGVVGGRGIGVDHPRRTYRAWVSISAGLLAAWQHRGSRLALRLNGLVPVVVPRLSLDTTQLPRPEPVGASAEIALGLPIP